MDDLALLHRGDLESARLSRDHADALRRSSEELRPIALALRVADGRAYDPSGIIPQLRAALDEWIGRHEAGARDMDARAAAYEANAASRVSASDTLTLAEMVRQLVHNVLVCAGAAALGLLAYHAVEKWRGHLNGSGSTTSANEGRFDCQPARDVDPRSAPNIDPAMASLMMEPRNVGMGVRRRRV